MGHYLLFIEVILLVGASAICSGLNIGLMSLHVADLKRKAKLGNVHAKRVLPLRKNGHLTLSAILFTNVAVISATSLVLEHHFSGLIAGLISTLLIVVFGEVLPQAWFSRFALRFTSTLSPVLKLMVIATYPVSKPLQLGLDKILGNEAASLHTRRELSIIIGEHLTQDGSELDEDEIEIMRSTLMLSNKRVREIMTPLEQVYWLSANTLIDADKIDEIKAKGRSRIPIFTADLTECVGILRMKDLVDIDFDDRPKYVHEMPLHNTKIVGSMTALDTLFRKFIGARSHLIPVERDDHIAGIVTIEDLLEEILGHEIEDEDDFNRPH